MIIYYFILALLLALGVLFIKQRFVTKVLVITFLLLQALFTIHAIQNIGKTELQYFTFDALGVLFLAILSIIAIASVYHGFKYFDSKMINKSEENDAKRFFYYHAALIGLITSISGAYLANDVTVVWIFVEATTLTLSILIYHEKTKYAVEATWKYVFLCSTGIAIAYMGILFLSVTMNGSEFKELSFAAITKVATNANPLYLKIAFIFVFVGFSTKMELFPMHTVGIDANSVAPSPIGGIISTGLVNLGFIAIFRVYTALSHTSILSWMNNVFILSGVLSILVAAGYMLKAKHNKRIFAYSSLENMGLVAIGIGVGGAGYYAVILLLILHAFTKSSLFFQLGQVYRVLKTMRLDDSGQYMKLHPVGAMVLIIGLISIMAIPPSGLFVSEFMIFKALVADNRWFVLIITVVLLASVLYAMTTRIMHINFSMPRQTIDVTTIKISPIESLSQYIFLGIVIFLCFYQPPFLVDLINQSIASLPK